jgi:DNA primase
MRGEVAPLPPREAVLVLTVISHPAILDAEAEAFGAMDLANGALDRLRQAILDIAAEEAGGDAAGLRKRLEDDGFGELIGRLADTVRHGHDRFALGGHDFSDALAGWRHTMALHRKSSTLHKELNAAERALAEEGSEASLARLKDIQRQIESLEGREALIEGFGEQKTG